MTIFKAILVLAVILPSAAHAYIGPGAGLGAIAVTIALVLGLLLLVVGLVWFPAKRIIKNRRAGNSNRDLATGSK